MILHLQAVKSLFLTFYVICFSHFVVYIILYYIFSHYLLRYSTLFSRAKEGYRWLGEENKKKSRIILLLLIQGIEFWRDRVSGKLLWQRHGLFWSVFYLLFGGLVLKLTFLKMRNEQQNRWLQLANPFDSAG